MLIGRRAELDDLSRALAAAARGRPRAFAVTGEPGIGKSAFAEAVAAAAADAGFAVHWARCFEAGGSPPFWPWVQVLRELRPTSDGGAEVLGVLAGAGGPRAAAIMESQENRFHLFDRVTRLIREAGEAQPRLVVLEDAHAADAATLELARFFAGHAAQPLRLVLLVTARTEAAAPGAGEWVRDLRGAATDLPLEGLDANAMGALAADAGGGPLPEEAARSLREVTGGNPLFARALVRHLGPERLVAALAGEAAVPVPATVREVFEARFRSLPAQAVSGLSALAAAGRDIDVALARTVLGDGVDAAMDAAVAAGIIERGPAGRSRFSHALVQRALVDRLASAEAQGVHRRLADAIESLHGSDLAPHFGKLAHHFLLAGPDAADAAFSYGQAAGDAASAVGAHADAAEHYRRALDSTGGTEEERTRVLVRQAEAELRAGRVDAGRQTAKGAWERARRTGEAMAAAAAALAFAHSPEAGIANAEVVQVLVATLDDLGDRDRGLRARLRARLAAERMFDADGDGPEALIEAAVREAREVGDPAVVLHTMRFAQSANSLPAVAATCVEWASEAAAAADRIGDLGAKGEVLAYRSAHHLVLGRVDEFRKDTAALTHLASSAPTPLNQWLVTVEAACRALLDARFEEAAAIIERSATFFGSVPNALASWQFQQFTLTWERGADLQSFEPVLGALPHLRPGLSPMARSAIALVHATAGRRDDAAAVLPDLAAEVTSRRLPWVWLLSVGWLAEACRLIGDATTARVLLEALSPLEDLHIVGTTPPVACYWGSVRRHLANLSLIVGEPVAGAVEHAERGLLAHRRVGSIPFTVRSKVDLARALLKRAAATDGARATHLLAEARADAERLGMGGLLAEIDSEFGAVNLAPVGARGEPPPAPSPALVREGDYWSFTYEGVVTRLRDSKGVRYLAQLLRQPDREVHVFDLVGVSGGAASPTDAGASVLDARAREAYGARLRELEAELDDAKAAQDLGRSDRLRDEWEFVLQELGRATGLGGRRRSLGSSPAESARVAATKAIRGALRRIESADPALARHFAATVRTGAFCAYASGFEECRVWEVVEGPSR